MREHTSQGPSALAQFRALYNFLRATDQFDPDIVRPLIVGRPGLVAECLHVGRWEMGYVDLIGRERPRQDAALLSLSVAPFVITTPVAIFLGAPALALVDVRITPESGHIADRTWAVLKVPLATSPAVSLHDIVQ